MNNIFKKEAMKPDSLSKQQQSNAYCSTIPSTPGLQNMFSNKQLVKTYTHQASEPVYFVPSVVTNQQTSKISQTMFDSRPKSANVTKLPSHRMNPNFLTKKQSFSNVMSYENDQQEAYRDP